MFTHLILLHLIILITFGESINHEVPHVSLSGQPPVTSSLLGPNTPQTLLSIILSNKLRYSIIAIYRNILLF
jgi:hypothetical protein